MKLEKIHSSHLFNPDNIITNYEIFSKKNEMVDSPEGMREQKKFSDDGLFSKRIFGDMDAIDDYSCDCRKITGKFYDGCLCESCGTKVSYVGQNIERNGWIDCSFATYDNGVVVEESPYGFHIIKYVSYMMLEKVIGRENLKNIIHTKNTITINGDLDFTEIEEIQNSDPKCKYWFIGIEKFYEIYNEVLDYYFNLFQKEKDLYDLLKERDLVFTDKISVLSIVLRPAMRTADGLKLDEINVKYQNILKDMSVLKDPNMISIIRNATIENIQAEFFQLSEKIIEAIKSKSGLIRNQICGTRINYSARNIISPADKENKMDEVSVPYQTFLELYKFEIIKILRDTENISAKEAENEWYLATLEFNEKIWLIMNKIVKEHEVGCLLNRNPTISQGSILYVRVKEVKRDFLDVTLSLNNLLLSLLAGDYDGDVLNLISIKDKSTRELFKEIFSPISMIIDSINGNFNNALNLERDQVLGLNNLLL